MPRPARRGSAPAALLAASSKASDTATAARHSGQAGSHINAVCCLEEAENNFAVLKSATMKCKKEHYMIYPNVDDSQRLRLVKQHRSQVGLTLRPCDVMLLVRCGKSVTFDSRRSGSVMLSMAAANTAPLWYASSG